MLIRRFVMVVLLLSGAAVFATAAVADAPVPEATSTVDEAPNNATLTSAYPNPVAHGDPGEFVTIRFDEPTNTTGWILTDGKTTARLPNRTLSDTVAVAIRQDHARKHTDHPVFALTGWLKLADTGDRLELRANDTVLSTGRYRNAPQSERRDFETGTWIPIGATSYEPVESGERDAKVFVFPDASNAFHEQLKSANERILIGRYTFTSERLTETLIESESEGVEVRILLDGAPVGGMSDRQARLLDRLAENGIDVRLLTGPHTRYRHHHPKYVVTDSRAIVLTENFKPAGTGGMSSRGWGASVKSPQLAKTLASLHADDRTWRAATTWKDYREGRRFVDETPALGEYASQHEPDDVNVESATVLIAPDNAADTLVSRIETAEERLLIQQVRIDSRENRLLRAVMDAADRGVSVRVHLDGSWYVEDENTALAAWLNRRSEVEGWDLDARIDDPDGYEKIHTKGVIIDETAVIGSLNWVRSAKSNNREVLLVLDGADAADYYASVFESDWDEEKRPLPAGLLAVAAVSGAGTLLLARRITFVGKRETITDWQW